MPKKEKITRTIHTSKKNHSKTLKLERKKAFFLWFLFSHFFPLFLLIIVVLVDRVDDRRKTFGQVDLTSICQTNLLGCNSSRKTKRQSSKLIPNNASSSQVADLNPRTIVFIFLTKPANSNGKLLICNQFSNWRDVISELPEPVAIHGIGTQSNEQLQRWSQKVTTASIIFVFLNDTWHQAIHIGPSLLLGADNGSLESSFDQTQEWSPVPFEIRGVSRIRDSGEHDMEGRDHDRDFVETICHSKAVPSEDVEFMPPFRVNIVRYDNHLPRKDSSLKVSFVHYLAVQHEFRMRNFWVRGIFLQFRMVILFIKNQGQSSSVQLYSKNWRKGEAKLTASTVVYWLNSDLSTTVFSMADAGLCCSKLPWHKKVLQNVSQAAGVRKSDRILRVQVPSRIR